MNCAFASGLASTRSGSSVCDYQAAFYLPLRGFRPFSAVCQFIPGIAYLFVPQLCAVRRSDSAASWGCYIPNDRKSGFKPYALRVCRMLSRHFHSDQDCKTLSGFFRTDNPDRLFPAPVRTAIFYAHLQIKGIEGLPLPLPPMTSTFLFLAVFGSLGRLFIVRRSVCVKMTLFWNTGSI